MFAEQEHLTPDQTNVRQVIQWQDKILEVLSGAVKPLSRNKTGFIFLLKKCGCVYENLSNKKS